MFDFFKKIKFPDMSLRSKPEGENAIKSRENEGKSSEVIPSLLLITDDVISPINVVFEATNKLFFGETFNEKNSREELFLNEDKVDNSPEMSKLSDDERSEWRNLEDRKIEEGLIRSTLARRKSDCPARDQGRVQLDDSAGMRRVKSKSIERAVDIELSSHHLLRSAANQKLNIGNLILNLSGELGVHQAPGQGEIKFPESKIYLPPSVVTFSFL